ncbi:DUF1254 domain-containing protein [Kitasatospora aburaviensis]
MSASEARASRPWGVRQHGQPGTRGPGHHPCDRRRGLGPRLSRPAELPHPLCTGCGRRRPEVRRRLRRLPARAAVAVRTGRRRPRRAGPPRPGRRHTRSWAWLDLRAEPWVVSVPAADRYYVLPVHELDTVYAGFIGARATGQEAGDHLVAGPGWQGRSRRASPASSAPRASWSASSAAPTWPTPRRRRSRS